MIRITKISALDGKATTRTFTNHAAAVEEFNRITKDHGMTLAATMTSGGTIMRAYASGAFTRATDRATWAN